MTDGEGIIAYLLRSRQYMVEDTGGGTRKGNGIPATATNTAEGVTTPNLLQKW